MENKIIVVNQKNYLTLTDIQIFLDHIEGKINKDDIIFCPSFPYLTLFKDRGYLIGSQNVSSSDDVMTGEVSARMLKSLGVSYVIIGHSERRGKENHQDFIAKIKHALKEDIIPILCVGEAKNENAKMIIQKELNEVLSNLTEEERKMLIFSYEPIYAIGKNDMLDVTAITQTIQWMKEWLKENYQMTSKILYGGGIDDKNMDILRKCSVLDGYLIGRFGCESSKLMDVIEVAVKM